MKNGHMAMVAPMNGEVVLLGGGDMVGIILNAFHLGLFNGCKFTLLRTFFIVWGTFST